MDRTRYGTREEWKEYGFHVIKGERAHHRHNGVPVFSEHQVEKTVKHESTVYFAGGDYDDYEDDMDRDLYGSLF